MTSFAPIVEGQRFLATTFFFTTFFLTTFFLTTFFGQLGTVTLRVTYRVRPLTLTLTRTDTTLVGQASPWAGASA